MRKFSSFALTALMLVSICADALARTPYSRIKDIADFEGVRSNMLIGYGLVIGLAGTGDSVSAIPFTRQSLINMLEQMGVNAKAAESQLKTKNVAAVMITANMPSYARQGSRIDVTVSSLGDAKSLAGGQLVATPLMGADGNTYAVAQGPVLLGGFSAQGNNASLSKNHATTGSIAAGAVVEVETGHEFANKKRLRILLRNPDFTTAKRMKDAINKAFGEPLAKAVDNHTIDVAVPVALRQDLVPMVHKLENIRVRPDTIAKVVIDEKTGTIVMGNGVQISDVAISHANLTIRISELTNIIQPEGFSDGITAAAPATDVEVDEDPGKFHILDSGPNLADLVDGLNSLGVLPRDVVSILQAIKAAGALQADVQLM